MRLIKTARPDVGDIYLTIGRQHLAAFLIQKFGDDHFPIPENDPDLCPLLEAGMRRPHQLPFNLFQKVFIVLGSDVPGPRFQRIVQVVDNQENNVNEGSH